MSPFVSHGKRAPSGYGHAPLKPAVRIYSRLLSHQ